MSETNDSILSSLRLAELDNKKRFIKTLKVTCVCCHKKKNLFTSIENGSGYVCSGCVKKQKL